MRLVTDNKIPGVIDRFSPYVSITEISGDTISPDDLKNAQILLTRTITNVSQNLLNNTAVTFVGSATAGTDHIDMHYLNNNNITLATAAGANATAVAEYVLSCLAALKKQKLIPTNPVVGIIGCGNVGSTLAGFCQLLGMDVLCNDPLLTHQPPFHFTDLKTVVSNADVISVHTPLTKTGPYPTYHMINQQLLNQVKKNTVIINTARGEVIDQRALLTSDHLTLCLDVWENEPNINQKLLDRAFIATPHIAGYTTAAKQRATDMLFFAAAKYFNWPTTTDECNFTKRTNTLDKENWETVLLSYFNPKARTLDLKKAIATRLASTSVADVFKQQRNLPFRQGFL